MTYVFYSKIAPAGIYYDDQGNRVKIEKGSYEENDVLAPAQPTQPPLSGTQSIEDRIAAALEGIARAVEKITR